MDFKDILIRRRAINFFDPERNVDDATVLEILENAAKAPSSFNLQPWKVIVFRDHEQKEKLRKLANDQPKVSEAPVVLMILGDREGWKEGNETFESYFSNAMTKDQREWFVNTTKALYGSNEMFSQAFANKNAGLFAMSLMYAASEMGLHTHPMDGFDHDGIRAAFDIPDNYWIPMLIAVGYAKPGLDIHPKGWRQSPKDIILRTY
ncbi:nitroreductase family protein [Pseudodesulfovibrio sp.]|uniref:nitroreductase family protein n=1 Tax=unclassified Pseudodesulfovibrio TaxID=2661612 RepID=UPI003B00FB27